MQGTDSSEQVVGWIKPSLLLLHGPPQVTILHVGGRQIWRYIQINLPEPHVCAAALGIWVVSYSEPQVNAVRNCCTLFCAAHNFLWVAAQVGYTPC